VWWISHLALGTTIGLVYLLLERRRPAIPMAHGAQTMAEVGVEKAA
jgi:hypothetical protein